jgi:hypothetical protein
MQARVVACKEEGLSQWWLNYFPLIPGPPRGEERPVSW